MAGGTVIRVSYQSLYRRFRPQTFAELQGQEHVAVALSNAVRNETVSHAYLFSGPRGTGKTSSARILAKALNCTNLQGGEPCGVCDSCVQVVAGSSMDVFELDAASNNGVESMRELVGRAALGTAGRRKVYIIDEVHMLSTAASNALLKTLEEPPDHVVFVLATTDPQKVLATIISRTQHFEFRLASLDTLNEHLKSVASLAGIELDDDTVLAVARRGNGSFRDALSVLDQVATLGHIDQSGADLEAVVGAIADKSSAAVLASIGSLVDQGRDPRQLVRDLVSLLRECFLSLMAPSLVGQGSDVAARFATNAVDLGRRLGTALTVRSIEVLGDAGVAMRDAIDPRTTLEVALVKLVRPDLDTSASAIMARLDLLEAGLPSPVSVPAHQPISSLNPAVASVDIAHLASVTTLVQPTQSTTHPAASPILDDHLPIGSASGSASGSVGSDQEGPTSPPVLRSVPTTKPPSPAGGGQGPQGARAALAQSRGPQSNRPTSSPQSVGPGGPGGPVGSAPGRATELGSGSELDLAAVKDAFMAAIDNRMTRAMFNAGRFASLSDTSAVFALPNEMTLNRCTERVADVSASLHLALGRTVALSLVVDAGATPEPNDPEGATASDRPSGRPSAAKPSPLREAMDNPAPTVVARALPEDHEVDLAGLSDAPSISPVDVILKAFPGAEIIDQE